MKLPSVYTDLCFKQVFENTIAGRNSGCLPAVKSSCCDFSFCWLFLFQPAPGHVVWYATRDSQKGVYEN